MCFQENANAHEAVLWRQLPGIGALGKRRRGCEGYGSGRRVVRGKARSKGTRTFSGTVAPFHDQLSFHFRVAAGLTGHISVGVMQLNARRPGGA
ncbi:MAG TPA: hypothetical protein VMH81_02085 [Bryobacteraceae bacterium]|nr:hypothetical protein [Bryobacteraceae bacterium]